MGIKFIKKDRQGKKVKKERNKPEKIHVKKVGIHRKSVVFMWILLIGSVSFGIYKNFTAVDTHHETVREVVEMKLFDTNSIESFVENFVRAYYAWDNTKESIEKRQSDISVYLTEDLQYINDGLVPENIAASSKVDSVQIWQVKECPDSEYDVIYQVKQTFTEMTGEGKKAEEKQTASTVSYKVRVYVDTNGNMVIIQNPTICSILKKSGYVPKPKENDSEIDPETVKGVTDFLYTFFSLYPKATSQELIYYVKDSALEPVDGNFTFMDMINPVFQMGKDGRFMFSFM